MTHDPMTPLAIYIHWPFCKSKCPYCDFNSHVRESVDQERWKNALIRELEYMAAQVPERQVVSIFFGGGTPSLMPTKTVEMLIKRIHEIWPVDEHVEITLEANPTSVETDTFKDFAAAGINRVSLGVQSLDDTELAFLGRGHNAKEAITAIERAKKIFTRYSFDLIYARPNQTPAVWEKELRKALALADGHISLYQLTIEENTAFAHAYKAKQFILPNEHEAAALYQRTEDITKSAGLCAYEISNYATPGQESRHNLAYWRGDEYIGIGPGAHGRIIKRSRLARSADRDSVRIATATLKSPERWLEMVERQGHAIETWQAISPKEEIEERVMMGMRLTGGMDYAEFFQKTGVDLRAHLHPQKLQHYKNQGLITPRDDRLQTTLPGRLVLNALLAEIL